VAGDATGWGVTAGARGRLVHATLAAGDAWGDVLDGALHLFAPALRADVALTASGLALRAAAGAPSSLAVLEDLVASLNAQPHRLRAAAQRATAARLAPRETLDLARLLKLLATIDGAALLAGEERVVHGWFVRPDPAGLEVLVAAERGDGDGRSRLTQRYVATRDALRESLGSPLSTDDTRTEWRIDGTAISLELRTTGSGVALVAAVGAQLP
jgi:hypothetical protein